MTAVRRIGLCIGAAAVLAGDFAAAAESVLDAGEQHRRLQAEEQAVRAVFAAERVACEQRFFVTSCIDDTRQRERDALTPLRQQRLSIDDAERQRRAAERGDGVARKQAAAATASGAGATAFESQALPAGVAPVPAAATVLSEPSAVAVPPPPMPLPPLPPSPAAGPDPAAAREAAERAVAAEQRRQAAARGQARIAEREAQRQAGGKASPALPVPAASR